MLCGKRNFGPDWLHIDGADFPHIQHSDILLQAHASNIVDLIYCSHGIAYFDRTEIVPILQAWFRVLKPGGVLRLSTTDFNHIANLYAGDGAKDIEIDKLTGPLFGAMELNGNKIYHKTVYDWNSLSNLLVNCGYRCVTDYDHRTTCHPNTGNRDDFYDDHSVSYINGQLISLNVQCVKP